LQDSEVVGPQATGGLEWVTNASSGSGYGWKQYTSSATGNLSIADRWNSATWTERVTFAGNTGNVSILSSTAGSASAGALVVTGGLSAGAASYIGGALTVNAAGTFAGAVDANVTSSNYITISSNATNKDAGFRSSDGTTLWIWGLLGDTSASTDGAYRLRQQGVGTLFSVAKNTGAATFAGAVTVTNVNSATGTVSAPNATATTLFAASTRGMYQVYAYIDAYDPNDWAATAVVTNTGNGSTLKITATNAASFTLTVSGLNVRVTQSGGSTFDVAWRYVRIQ